MRWVLAAVLALLTACPRSAPPPYGSAKAKPRLVVLVVIDQWPTWSFRAHARLFTGGIARLLREGAIVEAAELPYANTHTAPGHATLGTGAVPRETGIVGNRWYRRAELRHRPAEFDATAMPLSVGPALAGVELSADDGTSGTGLRVEGVADALRAGTNGVGKSVAIAIKSRAACLMAGRKPDLAIWYEPGAGGMTTSSAYTSDPPRWLRELAKSSPASRYYDATWTPRDRDLLARETGIADDAPGENSNHGLGPTFPHKLGEATKVAWAIQETPFADELVAQTVAVALDGMELGHDEAPDLLAVSFGAHDLAAHGWGQESWEVLDLELRLDALLGELFAALDARLGKHQWAVVLTSDHGATPLVERAEPGTARRIPYDEIEDAAQHAIAAETGSSDEWVVTLMANNLYLSPPFAELPTDVRLRALDAAARAIAAVPNVGGARRTDLIGDDCAKGEAIDRAVCNAVVPGEAGELYVWPAPGSVITSATFGTGHDAPDASNQQVPILVMAPGVKPQRGEGTLLQVAPTLAALLGVAPPSAARAQPLFGITRR